MKTKTDFTLGTSTVPTGTSGPWTLEEFEISKEEASFHNLRCTINGRHIHRVEPGRYRGLRHESRGVVMSNTPMEVRTNMTAFVEATGRVLINGLGMGMLLEALLAKPDVDFVRVVEIDPDVIALVGPHFANNPKVEIVNADAFGYKPPRGEVFDYVWHDIWDDICASNLEQMKQLVRKYRKPRARAQGVWSRPLIEAYARR